MSMTVTYTAINGRMVQEDRGGTVTRYVTDPLGSVVQTGNAAGNETSQITYWPFGEVKSYTGLNPSPWFFCGAFGYYADSEEMFYVRSRHYNPNLSRWTTIDPLWPHESAYIYGESNPVNIGDPLGLRLFDDGHYDNVNGWQIWLFWHALLSLLGTRLGRILLWMLLCSDTIYRIVLKGTSGSSSFDPFDGQNKLTISFTDLSSYYNGTLEDEQIKFTLLRLIAHELGHMIWNAANMGGYDEEQLVVDWIENVICTELEGNLSRMRGDRYNRGPNNQGISPPAPSDKFFLPPIPLPVRGSKGTDCKVNPRFCKLCAELP